MCRLPQGDLPMKTVMYEDGDSRHSVNFLAFALAHRANHVNAPPRYLLTFNLSPEHLYKHAWEGCLKRYS